MASTVALDDNGNPIQPPSVALYDNGNPINPKSDSQKAQPEPWYKRALDSVKSGWDKANTGIVSPDAWTHVSRRNQRTTGTCDHTVHDCLLRTLPRPCDLGVDLGNLSESLARYRRLDFGVRSVECFLPFDF